MAREISTQRRTAEALIAAYNAMDVDAIATLRTDECLRVILPQSLKLAPTDKAAFTAQLKQLKPIFRNFSLTVHDLVEDLPARKIVAYLTAHADTAAGEYVNEYVWFMEFDEAGQKIVSWKEFVDVGVNRDFWPKLSAAKNAAATANAS